MTIFSPTNGTIVRLTENINPYAGNVLFDVAISINPDWEVHLTLEPGFLDAVNNSLQSDNILVSQNDVLKVGDVVATLLYSENHAHLHYMLMYRGSDVCAYNYSSPTAQDTFNEIATRSDSVICYPLGIHKGDMISLWSLVRERDDSIFF